MIVESGQNLLHYRIVETSAVSRPLFVYGTLRRKARGRTSRLLGSDARLVGLARARGRLFDLGPYPGFVPSETSDRWVHGELYVLERSESTLARLDAYEGCGTDDPAPREFERIEVEVIPDTGATMKAWTYAYRGPTAGRRTIESGDYSDPAP